MNSEKKNSDFAKIEINTPEIEEDSEGGDDNRFQ